MFSRSYKRRDSSRSLNRAEEPHRGQPCLACGEQCPGFALHKWSQGAEASERAPAISEEKKTQYEVRGTRDKKKPLV
ncbi:hypothetical protein KUCAC02_030975, partial [Chaenocephalus aceratus]